MQKPRPKEATAPRQQRSTREKSGSNKGASAPFSVPGGEKAPETPAKPTDNGALPKANPLSPKKAGSEPAVIVFGFNAYRIPQAAWFPHDEADLATRAARLMGLRALKIENAAHRELAARLRRGQVYASDPTFAPAIQRELFEELGKLAGPVTAPSPAEVIADRDEAASYPATWQAIAVGSVVLAHLAHDEGWWEAIVLGAKDDKLVLRWRDYARKPGFTRAPSELALLTDLVDVSRIRDLNDQLRRSLNGGVLVMTAGVIALGAKRQMAILSAVAAYDAFDPDNDPYGEHDFGALTVEGTRVFFKIDYLDRSLTGHSPDPADPTVTTRVLTVMLAEEY